MSMKDDKQFSDEVIHKVSEVPDEGYTITVQSGFSFFIKKKYSVIPKPSDNIRFYGKGFGFSVRGISINEQVLFYQSEEDFKVSQEEETYGKDAQDWLDRWDSDKTVWSVEMGGLGPGYEQCIQIIGAETLRMFLDLKPDFEKIKDNTQKLTKLYAEIDRLTSDSQIIKNLGGVTGAQVGAGRNIAACIYRHGPVKALTDHTVKDRLIQVSRTFPNPY